MAGTQRQGLRLVSRPDSCAGARSERSPAAVGSGSWERAAAACRAAAAGVVAVGCCTNEPWSERTSLHRVLRLPKQYRRLPPCELPVADALGMPDLSRGASWQRLSASFRYRAAAVSGWRALRRRRRHPGIVDLVFNMTRYHRRYDSTQPRSGTPRPNAWLPFPPATWTTLRASRRPPDNADMRALSDAVVTVGGPSDSAFPVPVCWRATHCPSSAHGAAPP